ALINVLDECNRRDLDAGEVAGRDLADGYRVRPDVIRERLDVNADADDQEDAIILNPRLGENAGDLSTSDDDVIRPLDPRVDGEDVAQICGHGIGYLQRNDRQLGCRAGQQRGVVNAFSRWRRPLAAIASY